MALTTRTLPALMNGISQQPPILRSFDQTQDEVNTWGKIATGLARRPPTTTLKKLGGLLDIELDDASVHHINRDIFERYTVVITTGGIRVFDESDGTEKTVNAPLGWGYLDASVGTAYRAITVADYTFVVNTEKVVTLGAVADDEVAQDTNYRWLGSQDRNGFLDALINQVLTNGQQAQYRPNTAGTFTSTVARVEDLPDPVCSGCVYQIKGDAETSFVSYYVRGDGTVWNETVKPGLINVFTASTMPHALVREADGTFTFAPFSWQCPTPRAPSRPP